MINDIDYNCFVGKNASNNKLKVDKTWVLIQSMHKFTHTHTHTQQLCVCVCGGGGGLTVGSLKHLNKLTSFFFFFFFFYVFLLPVNFSFGPVKKLKNCLLVQQGQVGPVEKIS